MGVGRHAAPCLMGSCFGCSCAVRKSTKCYNLFEYEVITYKAVVIRSRGRNYCDNFGSWWEAIEVLWKASIIS